MMQGLVTVLRERRSWVVVLAVWVALAATFALAADERDQWQQPGRVMADLGLRPGAAVADVGCGYGYFTFRLRDAVGEKGKVVAADIDPGAVEAVRKAAARDGLSNVETIVSDPTDAKLQPESIDACLVCDVIHEADRRPKPLSSPAPIPMKARVRFP